MKTQARRVREDYAKNPKRCVACNKVLEYQQRKNTYCCQNCATKHYQHSHPEKMLQRSVEVKHRIKEGTWKKPIPPKTHKIKRVIVQCEHCQKGFEIYPIQVGKRRFCSKRCANDGFNAKTGGLRENSGRGAIVTGKQIGRAHV